MRLFRKSFLANIANNDELETIVPRRYTPLFWQTATTGMFALTGFTIWLLLGSLPVYVEARGVILELGGIREVSSSGSGVIIWQGPRVNDHVLAGELVTRVRNVLAEATYAAAREKFTVESQALARERYSVLQAHDYEVRKFEAQKRSEIERRAGAQAVESQLTAAISAFLAQRKISLSEQQDTALKLSPYVDSAETGISTLGERGLLSQRQVLLNLEQIAAIEQRISRLEVEAAEIAIEAQRLTRDLNSVRAAIATHSIEINRLDDSIKDSGNRLLQRLAELDVRLLALEQSLLNAEQRLWFGSNIYSTYDGTLLALQRSIGQTIDANVSVALMNLSRQEQRLLLIISPLAEEGDLEFSIADEIAHFDYNASATMDETASALQEALAQLLPDAELTVEAREDDRFVIGSDPAHNDALLQIRLYRSALRDPMGLKVFSILLEVGDNWSPEQIVNVGIVSEKDSKRINIGAKSLVRPYSEPALIGAEISGTVGYIGAFVQTAIEIEGFIGSRELSNRLLGGDRGTVVIVNLERDLSGNLTWVGGSPEYPASVGATTHSRIEVASVAPIRVLIPWFAQLFDVQTPSENTVRR